MTQVSRINRSSHTTRGFTLIELIATMVLIGILAVSVAPKFFGPSSYSAYAVRSELISYLRNTQLRAMNNTDQCFRFSATSQGYQALVADKNSNGSCGVYRTFLPTNSWPSNVEVTSHLFTTPTTFYFDFLTSGALHKNGTFSQNITITITAGDAIRLQISEAGYIRGI
ncbi:prepilin-type N-terminal cleavage/methylation domain-containing protein [Parashewanella tropica]|uniref:prepilin-type N-terminal cleavage/methylation domain-containing protein n=1 Tax=Parashewanella tropica TaxID=2547970 RepID=UPI00105AAC98|nr:prepilin-type N-terminal cleavage/methylation domain-containing protein [Parashewanella tropica]